MRSGESKSPPDHLQPDASLAIAFIAVNDFKDVEQLVQFTY